MEKLTNHNRKCWGYRSSVWVMLSDVRSDVAGLEHGLDLGSGY